MNSFEQSGDTDRSNLRRTEIEQKQMDIACLKNNLTINRVALSKTIEAICSHCFANANEDPLLFCPRDNPYKNQNNCVAM